MEKSYIDYPLQGSQFDIAVDDLVSFDPAEREKFLRAFLRALGGEIESGSMALKRRVTFKSEIADYRRLLRAPFDAYLLTDTQSKRRNVLSAISPGQSTHTFRSRTIMWEMVTKQGSLKDHIINCDNYE